MDILKIEIKFTDEDRERIEKLSELIRKNNELLEQEQLRKRIFYDTSIGDSR